MTQALSGAVIAAVIAAYWLLGRRRPTILKSTDASAVAALNRSRMELVLPKDTQDSTPEPDAPVLDSRVLPAPADLRGRPAFPPRHR